MNRDILRSVTITALVIVAFVLFGVVNRLTGQMAPFVFVFVVLLLAASLIWLKSQWKLRTRGFVFRILRGGAPDEANVEYTERREGTVRKYLFGHAQREGYPRLIILPPADRWDIVVPPWLHGRREEIITRLRDAFPSSEFALCDYDGHKL